MDSLKNPASLKTKISNKTARLAGVHNSHDDNQIWHNIQNVKDCLHGYFSPGEDNPENYQRKLTKALVFAIRIKSGFDVVPKKALNQIIHDYRRYDYKINPNWKHILERVGNQTRQEIYLDFAQRLIGDSRRYTLFQIRRIPVISLEDRGTKYTINQIIKQLKVFVPSVSPGFVKTLMKNEVPKAPLTWVGTQYEFDYFIKSLPGLNQAEYKKVLDSYFVFPDGPASVRTGGSFAKNHKGKPYCILLDEIISNLKLLK